MLSLLVINGLLKSNAFTFYNTMQNGILFGSIVFKRKKLLSAKKIERAALNHSFNLLKNYSEKPPEECFENIMKAMSTSNK